MPRGITIYQTIQITPVITATSYSTGNQLGAIQELTSAIRTSEADLHGTMLETISLIDKANQKQAIDLLFFRSSPTLSSTDANAIDISGANLVAAGYQGLVSIAAGDYATIKATTNAVATKRALHQPLKAIGGSTSIFVVAVIRGSATYATTSDLTFIYGFQQV